MKAYTVHVVDDDAAFLRTLGRQLTFAGYEVYLYQESAGVLATNDNLWRGCLLIDVRMPRTDGLSLLAELRQRNVNLPAVMMSGQTEPETVMRAAKLGASGFLGKPFEEQQLFLAIDAAMAEHPTPELRGTVERAVRRIEMLSPRESEVLFALARGDSHKAIAFELGISVRTVEVHSSRMLRRLGLRRLAEAIRLQAIADLAEKSASDAANN
ncbi:response regulator [Devosia sp. ZB163]|uniref:response regulator transcription factor n=1 Tax=Devosia sp. ZB163 TaxID=3025938 RepID=UPI00236108E4|nr:response regulator [Devosia sp. ZB163]MDC9822645.1 response regulator [Devosia sp. ZB163]